MARERIYIARMTDSQMRDTVRLLDDALNGKHREAYAEPVQRRMEELRSSLVRDLHINANASGERFFRLTVESCNEFDGKIGGVATHQIIAAFESEDEMNAQVKAIDRLLG